MPPNDRLRQLMSSLADGAPASAGDAAQASAAWRDEPEAARTWHAYQLIGDVMRSEELASSAAHDSAFLNKLRQRLAEEPVVLAPAAADAVAAAVPAAALATPLRGWRRAALPMAVAAGFVAVAGVLVVLRLGGAPGTAGEPGAVEWLAGQIQAPQQAPAAGVMVVSQGGWPVTASGVAGNPGAVRMIRDPQLDAYLRAHRGAFAGAAVGLPNGNPRSLGGAAPTVPVSQAVAQPVAR